jgi:hypothetical protein
VIDVIVDNRPALKAGELRQALDAYANTRPADSDIERLTHTEPE